MISAFFSSIWTNIISILIDILPTSSGIPSNVQTALTTFFGYVNGLNYILPIDTMLIILGLYITYEASVMLFHFLRFVFNLIRGSGG